MGKCRVVAARRGTPVCLGKHHRCGSGPCPKLGIKIRNFPAILVAWKDKSKRKQVSQQKKGRKMIGFGGFLPIFLGRSPHLQCYCYCSLFCFTGSFWEWMILRVFFYRVWVFWIFFSSRLVESVMNLSIWAPQMPFDPLNAWKNRFEPSSTCSYLTTRYRFGWNIFGLFPFPELDPKYTSRLCHGRSEGDLCRKAIGRWQDLGWLQGPKSSFETSFLSVVLSWYFSVGEGLIVKENRNVNHFLELEDAHSPAQWGSSSASNQELTPYHWGTNICLFLLVGPTRMDFTVSRVC